MTTGKIDRVALLNGSALGLGKACCEVLLKDGFHIAAFDLDEEALDRTTRELSCRGEVFAIHGDAASINDVRAAVAGTMGRYGRIDALVNVTGGSMRINAPLEEIALADFEHIVQLNLFTTFYFLHEVLPVMKKQKYGRVVNMSSMAGRARSSGNAGSPYSAAKAAVIGLTRQLSSELGPYGITINAVAPGAILSGERIRTYWKLRPQSEVEAYLERTPMRRFGEPGDVANAVRFLCREESSFITGAVFDVNGGAWVG